MNQEPHDAVTNEEILDGVRGFIAAEVIKRHDDHRDIFDDPHELFGRDGRLHPRVLELLREVRVASADAGFYTMFAPSVLGGAELGPELLYRVYETIFRNCGPNHWLGWHMIGHWAKGPSEVLAHVPDAVRESVLPSLMSGHSSMCFAMSEPDAGTDVWAMTTTATRDGDGWSLSGVKQWITNGPYAEYALVFAVTDRDAAAARRGGITAFLVPTDAPGFQIAGVIRMFGAAGGDEAVIHLDGVRVDPSHVVGEVDHGFAVGMLGVGLGKLYNSAKAVGLGQWALAKAADQLRSRQTFGRPIGDHQGALFPIAESAMELRAARLMALEAARIVASGVPGSVEVAMAKAFSSEASLRAIDRSIQVHGATGFTNELHLTEAWRDIRKICVADGSAEIMRRQIGREIMRGQLTF